MQRLNKLMDHGWNIFIECKGRGREYAMTFEATANRVVTPEMTLEEEVRTFYPIHVVGDSFNELIEGLENKLMGGE